MEVVTAVCGDELEPPARGCWCCGDTTVQASRLHLDAHREVGVCFRCVELLARRKRKVERMTRQAPPGPWWRRAQFRIGFGHC